MKGTEKQVAWAEDIKANAIGTIEANIQRDRENADKDRENGIENGYFEQSTKAWEAIKDSLIKALDTYEDAAQLIQRRDNFAPERILQLHTQMMNKAKANA